MTQPDGAVALHPVRKALDDHGITKVVVIDDAYDTPDLASFIAGEVEEFLAEVEGNDEVLTELSELGIDLGLGEGLTDEHVELLWKHREGLTHLKAVVDTLFAAKLGMLRQLKEFVAHLDPKQA